MWLILAIACSGDVRPEAETPTTNPTPPSPRVSDQKTKAGQHPAGAGHKGPDPHRPPPGQEASGAALQDPTGFPIFHSFPAPAGPKILEQGSWTRAKRLTTEPGGGYRPQVVVGADDTLHVVYYERLPQGDLIRHRTSEDGSVWTSPQHVGFDTLRNWGPDIVARDDGSVVLCFDHAQENFSSQGYMTTWEAGTWTAPEPLTAADPEGEIGSGHIANASGDDIAYVWIGKKMDPAHHFQAYWRWRSAEGWSTPVAFTDGRADAWHTNVERRPDGSVLAAWDVGVGGGATTLFVADGRDGAFSPAENLSESPGSPGERAHFAFGQDGRDHVTWFHKTNGAPRHIYVRSGRPGAWESTTHEPSAGYGGFHFDPDIAIDAAGTRVLVWGWDQTSDAELVYSVAKDQSWSSPLRVATIGWGKPGLPSIAVDSRGTFHAVWNQGIRGENHVYYAQFRP